MSFHLTLEPFVDLNVFFKIKLVPFRIISVSLGHLSSDSVKFVYLKKYDSYSNLIFPHGTHNSPHTISIVSA
jgi:hypothetical protein